MAHYIITTAQRDGKVDVTDLAVAAHLTYPRNHRYHGIELNVTGLQDCAQRAAGWLAVELGADLDVVRVTAGGKKHVVISSHYSR